MNGIKMKFRNIFLLITLVVPFLHAQNAGLVLKQSTKIAPGVVHNHLTHNAAPLSVHILEIDLHTAGVDLQMVTARDSVAGLQRLSDMVAHTQQQGKQVYGAINADFFEKNGQAVNMLMIDGTLVHLNKKSYSVVGITSTNQAYFAKPNFLATVQHKNRYYKLNGLNSARTEERLVLYTPFWGSHTRTNDWGSEVVLTPLKANGHSHKRFSVFKVNKGSGNHRIYLNQHIISGHGKAASFLNGFTAGDTVTINISMGTLPQNVEEISGGFVRLLKNGKNHALQSYLQNGTKPDYFVHKKHPRTAIGTNKDKSTLWLVTVDGRQTASAGISLPDLADLMKELGAYNALNLDGGGSTTMWVKNRVVNRPSDAAGERRISNGLLILKR